MTPEERLRALRDDDRWASTRLAPRATAADPTVLRLRREAAMPVIVTVLVAALVVALSVGAIRLAATPHRPQPAAPSATPIDRATAVIRGTAPKTTRVIAGVGTPGGPTGSALDALRARAKRTGKLVALPPATFGYQARLSVTVDAVRAAFGSAAHEYGGYGRNGFFLVLGRAPTSEELQLLRLIPMTVRLHWGPQLSTRERDRQRLAAFAALKDAYDVAGDIDAETGTMTFQYWPNRDHPRSAQQVAEQMVANIERLTGKAPPFTISVTDWSRTTQGQAAMHATGRTLSDDGVRLLVAARPSLVDIGTGIGSSTSLGINGQRCVALGDTVIIARPGSSISADGRTLHLQGGRSYPIDLGTGTKPPKFEGGGLDLDAKAAATYLPPGSTLCGASHFLLIE